MTRGLPSFALAAVLAVAGCSSGGSVVGKQGGPSPCRPDKGFAISYHWNDDLAGGGTVHAFSVSTQGPICTMSGWPKVVLRTKDGVRIPTASSKGTPPALAIVTSSTTPRSARFNAFSSDKEPKGRCARPLLSPHEAVVTLPGNEKRTYKAVMKDAPPVCGAMVIGSLRSGARL